MSFPERRRAVTNAAFATFGEDAWLIDQGRTIRVRFKARDEEQGFGRVRMVENVSVALIRSWDVETVAIDDTFYIETGPNAGMYAVAAKPLLDVKGVWHCDVEQKPV